MLEFTLAPAELERWSAGDVAPVAAALARLGFTGDLLVEQVLELGRTLASPVHTAVLDLRQPAGDVQVPIAIGDDAVVAVLARPDAPELRSVLFGPLADLPRLVADLVDLGPRPFDASLGPVVIPTELLDAIAGVGLPTNDLVELHEQFAGIFEPRALDALLGTGSVRWTFFLGASDAAEPQRVADVIDAREGGLWVVLPDAEDSARLVSPITGGTLWRLLAGSVHALRAAAAEPVGA